MSPTTERILAAAGVAATALGAGVVWYFNPSNVNFLPVCPLYQTTGIACPGCGLTRAFHAFFRGDVFAALDYNALVPFFAAFFAYCAAALFLFAWRGRGLSFRFFRPAFLYAFFGAAFVFTVLRNLPVYPFSVLYP